MIEIKNLNKYFNKGKKNQIHVINNVNLTLNDNGLVALLGPSGSGKTTLLNTIGGLDNVKSGNIYIDGKKITSKLTYKRDKIRNINIGYIFQDYKLIDNMSVYSNVSLVLKMLGIKDKKEIKKRVDYVLEKVGMYRYRNRPCNMLSGGERQRVGIARAIVKDPDIIIADEPTGNLDSKNSLEIMNIIKAISKDRLVILVTHENNLAKFFASRVIEIEDGAIVNDYENKNVDALDYQIDNKFYLKDFENYESIKEKAIDVDVYSSGNDKIKLDIVVKNGNIYIKSNTKEKIEVIDENSSIEFVNAHYKKIDKETVNKYQFNFNEVINKNIKKKYSSIFNIFTLITNGFRKVLDFSVLKKILLIGFVLAGMFIMYSTSSIAANLKIDEDNFVTYNKNYLILRKKSISINDYLNYEKMEDISYAIPGDSLVNFELKVNDYYQTSKYTYNLKGSLSSLEMINKDNLILGKMPENEYEIVVDKLTINNLLNDNNQEIAMTGIVNVESFLNRKVTINNMKSFTIVGITDLHSPSIYLNRNLFVNVLANSSNKNSYDSWEIDDRNTTLYLDYQLIDDQIELKKGRLPSNDYEVLVNISHEYEMPLNKEITLKINDTKLTVVGYYYSKTGMDSYLVNNNMIKYNYITSASSIMVYSNNKDKTIDELRKLKLNIQDTYQDSKNTYLRNRKEATRNNIIVSAIILGISLIEIFLMIRSSFLSRIKEIGILRAIGVKRIDIYKMFMGEIIAITTLTSVPGILFMTYILKVLSTIPMFNNYCVVNLGVVLFSIILVYAFNILVGLLPVFNTVRKTPAAILSRHDLD